MSTIPDDHKGIGRRLRAAREKAGYETGAAATKAHKWNPSTYRSHENGNRPPPRDDIRAYAKAFNVSPSWLTYGEGDSARPEGMDVLRPDFAITLRIPLDMTPAEAEKLVALIRALPGLLS